MAEDEPVKREAPDPRVALGEAPTAAVPIVPAPATIATAPTVPVAVPPAQSIAFADTTAIAIPPPQDKASAPTTAMTAVGGPVPDAAPAPAPAEQPAPAPAAASAPTLASAAPRSSRKRVLAAVAAVVVLAGAVLGGLYFAGMLDEQPRAGGGPAVVRTSAPHEPAQAPARAFAHLDNKQVHARILSGGQKIVSQTEQGTTTTWLLQGNDTYVQMSRMKELKPAEALEGMLLKQPGATLRDGNTVLHVHMAQASEAKALLNHIIGH